MKNISKAAKATRFAISIILPVALMTYLMASTTIAGWIIILLTIALAVGLMVMLGVFEIPSTEMERKLVKEEAILKNIRELIPQITDVGADCVNSGVREALASLVTKATDLVELFSGDTYDSSGLAQEVYSKMLVVGEQVAAVNKLNLEPDNDAFEAIAKRITALSAALETMLTEHREGTIRNAVQALEILEKQLKIQGF